MKRYQSRTASISLFWAVILLPVAAGWLALSHRSVSVSCERANGKVDCRESERIADQSVWTQPVWSASAADANVTTRESDDEGNSGAVIVRTKGDTQRVQFTSGMLGTNEARVETELDQFLVVRTADRSLQFDLAPGSTWRDWAAPAALLVLLLAVAACSLFRLIAPAPPRPRVRRQTS